MFLRNSVLFPQELVKNSRQITSNVKIVRNFEPIPGENFRFLVVHELP
jgi:hypothetical protein